MKNKYCSINLQSSLYKTFTCLPALCPGGAPDKHLHEDFNGEYVVQKEWGWFANAFNCRISISASPHLNGKVSVDIEQFDALGWVYL